MSEILYTPPFNPELAQRLYNTVTSMTENVEDPRIVITGIFSPLGNAHEALILESLLPKVIIPVASLPEIIETESRKLVDLFTENLGRNLIAPTISLIPVVEEHTIHKDGKMEKEVGLIARGRILPEAVLGRFTSLQVVPLDYIAEEETIDSDLRVMRASPADPTEYEEGFLDSKTAILVLRELRGEPLNQARRPLFVYYM